MNNFYIEKELELIYEEISNTITGAAALVREVKVVLQQDSNQESNELMFHRSSIENVLYSANPSIEEIYKFLPKNQQSRVRRALLEYGVARKTKNCLGCP